MLSWLKQLFSQPPQRRRHLVVVSAPSGAGKTSLVKAVLAEDDNIRMAVSYTTRPQRSTEVDGQDYHFVDKARFESLRDEGRLLEWANVFDNYYGTGRDQVDALLAAGHDVVLEIDWQGARQVREAMPEAVSVFILPPSRTELERRLRGRETDSDEVIARRLRDSVADMSHWDEFDYVIVNDRFEEAARALAEVITGDGGQYARTRAGLAELAGQIAAD